MGLCISIEGAYTPGTSCTHYMCNRPSSHPKHGSLDGRCIFQGPLFALRLPQIIIVVQSFSTAYYQCLRFQALEILIGNWIWTYCNFLLPDRTEEVPACVCEEPWVSEQGYLQPLHGQVCCQVQGGVCCCQLWKGLLSCLPGTLLFLAWNDNVCTCNIHRVLANSICMSLHLPPLVKTLQSTHS